MLIITIPLFGPFRKKEIWFYDGGAAKESSYNTYAYATGPCTLDHFTLPTEQTARIDLRRSAKEILEKFNTTTKYHIRKAERMNLQTHLDTAPSETTCSEIAKLFDTFAANKKISGIHLPRLLALAKTGNLFISTVRCNDRILVRHIYLHDGSRVLLMHTFHDPETANEQTRGYANKYLHYRDIITFKEMGFAEYDWGGINEEQVPGITKFKLGFGGEVVTVYNYVRTAWPITPLYKLVRKPKKNGYGK